MLMQNFGGTTKSINNGILKNGLYMRGTVNCVTSELYFFILGTARDALTPHRGMLFTTKDGDNDKLSGANCAMIYKGAWWYYYCDRSDLNGLYRPSKGNIRGMYWWRHKPETTRSEMKIRPKNF